MKVIAYCTIAIAIFMANIMFKISEIRNDVRRMADSGTQTSIKNRFNDESYGTDYYDSGYGYDDSNKANFISDPDYEVRIFGIKTEQLWNSNMLRLQDWPQLPQQ